MAENAQIDPVSVAANDGKSTQKSAFSRLSGIGVFAAVALPIVAAYVIFYTGIGIPRGTVNEGELLTPAHAVNKIQLFAENGEPLTLTAEEPKWRYLILGEETCGDACAKLLYTTRQVHIRLGDKAHRVERLLVTGAPLSEASRNEIASEHPRLRLATSDPVALDNWLADSDHAGLKRPSALLVDQNGFAMMVYDNHHTGNQLLKDIKRLLKYSYEK